MKISLLSDEITVHLEACCVWKWWSFTYLEKEVALEDIKFLYIYTWLHVKCVTETVNQRNSSFGYKMWLDLIVSLIFKSLKWWTSISYQDFYGIQSLWWRRLQIEENFFSLAVVLINLFFFNDCGVRVSLYTLWLIPRDTCYLPSAHVLINSINHCLAG